jgi:NADPH-dependent F420 reductase
MVAAMKIAIIGAGNVGGNLGARLSKSGFAVCFGLKDGKDAAALLVRCGKDATTGTVEEAARQGDVVFLALPANVVVDVVKSLGSLLDGKIIVDCNNPLTWKDGPVWAPPAEGSLTQAIAKVAPRSKVLKAFNQFGAEHHGDPNLTGAPATVFIAGDDGAAKKSLEDIATKAGFHPIDAGPLRNAGVLENVAILWIHLAMVGGKGRGFTIELRGTK